MGLSPHISEILSSQLLSTTNSTSEESNWSHSQRLVSVISPRTHSLPRSLIQLLGLVLLPSSVVPLMPPKPLRLMSGSLDISEPKMLRPSSLLKKMVPFSSQDGWPVGNPRTKPKTVFGNAMERTTSKKSSLSPRPSALLLLSADFSLKDSTPRKSHSKKRMVSGTLPSKMLHGNTNPLLTGKFGSKKKPRKPLKLLQPPLLLKALIKLVKQSWRLLPREK